MKLPNSIESEKVIVAHLLHGKSENLEKILDYPEDDLFFDKGHSLIFKKVLDYLVQAEEFDIITIHSQLETNPHYKNLGGLNYLTSLKEYTQYSFDGNFKVILDKLYLRRKIELATKMQLAAVEDKPDSRKILDSLELELFEVTKKFEDKQKSLEQAGAISDSVLLNIDKALNSDSKYLGLPIGFQDIDEKMGGLHESDLTIVAARASAGKSSFFGSIVSNLLLMKQPVHILIFSLEMTKRQLIERLISNISWIPLQNIRRGKMSIEEWARFLFAVDVLKDCKLYIDDTPGLNILQINTKVQNAFMRNGKVDLVIVDYLQLMSSVKDSDNRANDVSQIAWGLKMLGKAHNVPVMALSQLSRAPDKRLDHKPVLSDLRESGAIEQHSDNVLFIYREELYNPTLENRNVAEIIIAKQRQGEICSTYLAFIKNLTKFMNVKKG